jgi:hypothetical protein
MREVRISSILSSIDFFLAFASHVQSQRSMAGASVNPWRHLLFLRHDHGQVVGLSARAPCPHLRHLPLTSLRGLLATSKALNNLISTSVLLQYLLHLQSSVHSLYPSGPTTSLVDQLKVLTDAEKRWQDWEYTSFNRLEVQHRPSGIYDLTSGIFILGEGSIPGRLTHRTALGGFEARKRSRLESDSTCKPQSSISA